MQIIRLPRQLARLDLGEMNRRLRQGEIRLDWRDVAPDSVQPQHLQRLFDGIDLVESIDALGSDTIPESLMPQIQAFFAGDAGGDRTISLPAPDADALPMTQALTMSTGEQQKQPSLDTAKRAGEERQQPLLTPPSPARMRQELEEMVVRDLLGPVGGEDEELDEDRVYERYLVGALAPSATHTQPEEEPALSSETAYTTRLVTATDDWSVRTLISGIAPQSSNGGVTYKVQYGHLTNAILKNRHFQGERPEEWSMVTLRRVGVTTPGGIERGTTRTFRGLWLVIDEFNRAPIDLALGDALTALGGNETLRVAIEGGSAELPIPQDFRIIGTLNSFDRSYLNQISEALKRRFSFIEVLPPTRAMRKREQMIVLDKALRKVSHLSDIIDAQDDTVYWLDVVEVSHDPDELFALHWEAGENYGFRVAFEAAWTLFEVIRIYRQLGTAQAISLYKQMLIAGLLQNYSATEDWLRALDEALCDTLADQLQVLLPDEIEALLLFLTSERADFSAAYQRLLSRLASTTPQRLSGQLLALSNVCNEQSQPYLTDADIEYIAEQNVPTIAPGIVTGIFHLEQPRYPLPQFTRHLRTFKTERGL